MATPQEPALGHGRPHRCQRRLAFAGLAGVRRLEGKPLQRDIALCFARVQDWLVNDPLFAGLNDSHGRRAQ